MTAVRFTVPGEPIPQGSLKAFVVGRRAHLTSDNPRTKAWRLRVAAFARAAHTGEPWDGPVKVRLVFTMPRPRGHYGTGRNAETVKASAPLWPSVRPDLDKCCRAIFDALSGVLWTDDALVVGLTATKVYGPTPGVEVFAERVEPPA